MDFILVLYVVHGGGFSTAVSLIQYSYWLHAITVERKKITREASFDLVHHIIIFNMAVYVFCNVPLDCMRALILHAARSLDLSVGCMHFSTVESREEASSERPKGGRYWSSM